MKKYKVYPTLTDFLMWRWFTTCVSFPKTRKQLNKELKKTKAQQNFLTH